MTCKGICTRYKAQKPVGLVGMLLVNVGVRFVRFSLSGKVYGVHAVDID